MRQDQENSYSSKLPTGAVEVKYDRGKLFGLTAIGLLFVAVGVAMATTPGPFIQVFVVGYFGTVFFGLLTIKGLWSLLLSSGPIVTITPEGIRDIRIAAQFIRWNAIERIRTWSYRGSKCMVLVLKPGVVEQLPLTFLARWSRIPNRLLGVDGLVIAATALNMDYQTLLDKSLAYLRAQQP